MKSVATTYTLQKWDIVISTTIHPENLQQFMDTENSLQVFIRQSEDEKEKLRTKLMQDFYSRAKLKKMEFDIRFNQTILIKLLDKLYSYKKMRGLNSAVVNLYNTISSHVSFILDFIEEYFDKYLDKSLKVPASYLDISKKEICKHLLIIQAIFKTRKEIDDKLSAIIIKSFNDFCSNDKTPFTYNDLIYQKDLIRELLSLSQIPKGVEVKELLKEMLVYMNFNDPDFILYYLSGVSEEVKALRPGSKKTERLLAYQKQLRLVQLRPSAGLHPRFPSTKETLAMALEKEAEYLNGNPLNDHTNAAEPKHGDFVNVPFRGAEIYLLHKSFIDSGGAPNEIYKTLLEKTAAHLANKTHKGFSADSMVKYSDKVDPESKDNVKRFLQKMIRNIDSYD